MIEAERGKLQVSLFVFFLSPSSNCPGKNHVSILQELNMTTTNDPSKDTTEDARRSMLEAQPTAIGLLQKAHEAEVQEFESKIAHACREKEKALHDLAESKVWYGITVTSSCCMLKNPVKCPSAQEMLNSTVLPCALKV